MRLEAVTPAEILELYELLAPDERREFDALITDLPLEWSVEQILFDKQFAFVRDPSDSKTAVCSRRAGKTVACAVELFDSNIAKPDAPSLYFTLTRGSGKRIVWSTLLFFNRKYSLGYEPNESDLVLKKGGEGRIYLTGADTKGEIEKWRGTAWGKAVGDEAQALPAFLKEAVEEVLEPSFMDWNGSLSLIGTPAPVPVGYFYECTKNPAWSHHAWTFFDNPWIATKSGKAPQVHLERALAKRGVTVDHPSIQREFFGRWLYDPDALVFKWNAAKNAALGPPAMKKPWQYVFGVDLGFSDSDAIAVLAFNEGSPAVYLREEHVEAKQNISQLTEKLQALVAKYEPISIVVDTGGLGRKITEEVSARTGLPLKAAEKSRKFEFIELLNDAMRTGRFFAPAGSKFAADCLLVEWDRDKSTNDRRVVSERYHSDVGDAVLYAYRESLHWLHVPAGPPSPAEGTLEWGQAQEDAMESAEEEHALQERQEREWGTGW